MFRKDIGLTEAEVADYNSTFQEIVKNLVKDHEIEDLPKFSNWMKLVLNYNLQESNRKRGLLVPLAYKSIVKDVTKDGMSCAYLLGSCFEFLLASFEVADDIMGDQESREGNPCWYRVDSSGYDALNDSLLLQSIAYNLLSRYLINESYYAHLVELFLDAGYMISIGRTLEKEMETQNKGTMKQLEKVVRYKYSHQVAYFPVALVLAMTGTDVIELSEKVEDVLVDIGTFLNVQEGFLNRSLGEDKDSFEGASAVESYSMLLLGTRSRTNTHLISSALEGLDVSRDNEYLSSLSKEMDTLTAFKEYTEDSNKSIVQKANGIEEEEVREGVKRWINKCFERPVENPVARPPARRHLSKTSSLVACEN